MLFGTHVSSAGGIDKAPGNAAESGCEVFQIFSRSPRGGPAPKLTATIIKSFRAQCERHGQRAWYIHTPYYINLASENGAVREASIRIIREELERGSAIGAQGVMTHLGSTKTSGEQAGRQLVIAGVQKILMGYKGTCELLLELSAGAGAVIGDTFEELNVILKANHYRCGVCLDTQHAFASGYDLRTPAAVKKTLDQFDRTIGLKHLKLIHANDSKVAFASNRDRHEHLGKGEIGAAGFAALVAERRLAHINFILETPTDEGTVNDLKLLKKFRSKGG